jgi:3-oxoacyl-[acyl-carrier protein] reductase
VTAAEQRGPRVAIVTGAARGIGRAFALRFARDGYRIAIADVNVAQAEDVCAEIAAAGGSAIAVQTDVGAEASCRACATRTLAAYGRIDVLINNAAMCADLTRRPFWEVDVEEWDRVLGVNARGTWLMMKAVAPALRAQRSGSIINMSSNTFLSGVPGFVHYVASKGAVVGITRTAARELGEYNVRVNCILPGLTRTEVVRASDEPGRYEQLLASQSIKRTEVPEDLVGTAAFLASDDSGFMTGQALTVDGGNSFH